MVSLSEINKKLKSLLNLLSSVLGRSTSNMQVWKNRCNYAINNKGCCLTFNAVTMFAEESGAKTKHAIAATY